jgi:hypothetical protein
MSIMARLSLAFSRWFIMQERADQPASVHITATAPGDLHNLHELVAKARQNLNQNDWDYIVGGAT